MTAEGRGWYHFGPLFFARSEFQKFSVFFTCFPFRIARQRSNEQHLHDLHNELCVWDWHGSAIGSPFIYNLV